MRNSCAPRRQSRRCRTSITTCSISPRLGTSYGMQQGKIVEVNLAGAALLGLDRNAVIQKRFGQFVAMEHRPAFADFCKRVLTTDTKQTCEVKLLRDGQPVSVLVEGIVAPDSRGTEKLCRAAVIDISQRKRAEEIRRESRAAACGHCRLGDGRHHQRGYRQRIVLFNAAAEKMFRCPAAEAIGQPPRPVHSRAIPRGPCGHVKAFGEAGTTSRAMGQLTSLGALRADGEEFPMEASISQVEVRGQKVFTVILRDITDRKQAEQVTADARPAPSGPRPPPSRPIAPRTISWRSSATNCARP